MPPLLVVGRTGAPDNCNDDDDDDDGNDESHRWTGSGSKVEEKES